MASDPTRPPRTSLVDLAHERIERALASGEVSPGSFVSEAVFVELSGLGRTPVREALHRLAREQLVEIVPSRGIRISDPDAGDVLRILELRRPLDELAATLAIRRATEDQRTRAQEMAERLATTDFSPEEYSRNIREVHELLAEASHNRYLTEALLPLQNLSRRYWIAHLRRAAEEIAAGAALHRAVLLAVASGSDQNEAAGARRARALNDFLVASARRDLE